MVEIRNPVQFAAVLFGGHDDGQWSLPDDLLAARSRYLRVAQLHADAFGATPENLHDLLDRLAGQVAAGADVDLAPLHAAQQGTTDHIEREALLRRAKEIAVNDLLRELNDTARAVVADHLQPAYAELVEKLRRDFATITDIPSDAPMSVILTAPKPVRDAAVRIDAAVARYDTLRQAYDVARRLGYPGEPADVYNWFYEVKNMETVWPEITGRMAVDPNNPPWPTTSTRAKLAWLFAHGAELWAPTAEEQAERWAEVFAERLKESRAARDYFNSLRAIHPKG